MSHGKSLRTRSTLVVLAVAWLVVLAAVGPVAAVPAAGGAAATTATASAGATASSEDVGAGATVAGCTVLSTPGVYRLTSDVNVSGVGDCLVVASDDVHLDGAGHVVRTGPNDTAVATGAGTYANVSVANLSVRGGLGVRLANVTGLAIRTVDVKTGVEPPEFDDAVGVNVVDGSDVRLSGVAVDLTADRGAAVQLLDVTNATVASTTVRNDRQGSSRGVAIRRSTDVRLSDTIAEGYGDAVYLAYATNVSVRATRVRGADRAVYFYFGNRNVTVAGLDGDTEEGVVLSTSVSDVTVRDASLSVTDRGIFSYADRLTLRNVTVVGATRVGVRIQTFRGPPLDPVVEDVTVRDGTATAFDIEARGSPTLRNLTVANVSAAAVVGRNESGEAVPVEVTGLRANGSRFDLRLVNASVRPVDAEVVAPPAGDAVGVGLEVAVPPRTTAPSTFAGTFSYDPSTLPGANETDIRAFRYTNGTRTQLSATPDTANETLTVSRAGSGLPGSYGLYVPLNCPMVDGTQTRSVDTDGDCEDVDGNGRFEFLDVVALLFADFGAINADPAGDALDIDGSGKVDFLDVVALLFELS
jgi:hypothetical protein